MEKLFCCFVSISCCFWGSARGVGASAWLFPSQQANLTLAGCLPSALPSDLLPISAAGFLLPSASFLSLPLVVSPFISVFLIRFLTASPCFLDPPSFLDRLTFACHLFSVSDTASAFSGFSSLQLFLHVLHSAA